MKKTISATGLIPSLAGLILSAIVLLSLQTFAQKKFKQQDFHRCYTHEKMMELRALDPAAYDRNKEKQEQILQNWIANNYNAKSQTVYTIPVVVQIFGASANTAVTDNRVNEQIAVLNQDYRRLNTDTNLTPNDFKSIAADVEFEFCLATVDPQGNATTGIVRYPSWSGSTPSNSYLWNSSYYLNLFVYDLSGNGTLGYTYLPSQSPNNAVHISYQYFGKTGASSPFNKGRTATHEVGHWFNLEHIWADDGGGCTADDGVSDTPKQKSEYYNCPSYPQTAGRCNTSDPSTMFMNYMDYVNDNCMNIFTAGQKARMVSAINNYRPNVFNNGKCGTTAPTDDAGIESISQPSGNICATSVTPIVILKNYGTNTLTSCTINYQIDANTPSTYSWNGNLAAGASANVTLSSMTTSGGIHTFTANTSSPNGNTDNDTSNDQATGSFSISTTGQSMPFTEGFEGTFIPSGWTLNNVDASTTWDKATVGYSGSASAFMDNYDYNASGQVDEMVSPAVDLSSGTNPTLTFQLAYQLYTNPTDSPNWADTLEVLISTDCGVSFTSLYKKFSSALTTVTPEFSTTEFVPADTGDWRMETISLSNYASVSNAIFKFRHATDYENNLYVDNINIAGGAPCNISATTTSTNATCGQSDGSATVSVFGNTTPVTYVWSNGQTTATATGLAAGTYSVTVTDGNNCTATAMAAVNNSGAPAISVSSTNCSANGVCDGSATVTATGGTQPYIYLWSDSSTTATVSGLCADTFYVTVTDGAGCNSVASVIITEPTGIAKVPQDFGINIFPNPNGGKFQLSVVSIQYSVIGIKVYNVLGETVYRIPNTEYRTQFALDLTNHPQGIYFVEISTGEKTIVRKISLIK